MSAYERLLDPGCMELPDCQCGQQMRIGSSDALSDQSSAHIRSASYVAPSPAPPAESLLLPCPKCNREMRLYGIDPDSDHRDLYTFQCTSCGHLNVRRIRIKPSLKASLEVR